uniref:Uncharacterized protein n=1 Tax=Marseillevirus LCMAC101 TaxID=2506602 RepID=A0A481YU05_9VIRU|nr:MAG: hypothetical protein LCMAC101_05990 [Marseillevirus LCMAC101]
MSGPGRRSPAASGGADADVAAVLVADDRAARLAALVEQPAEAGIIRVPAGAGRASGHGPLGASLGCVAFRRALRHRGRQAVPLDCREWRSLHGHVRVYHVARDRRPCCPAARRGSASVVGLLGRVDIVGATLAVRVPPGVTHRARVRKAHRLRAEAEHSPRD